MSIDLNSRTTSLLPLLVLIGIAIRSRVISLHIFLTFYGGVFPSFLPPLK